MPELITDILATYRLTRLAQVDEFPPVKGARRWLMTSNAPETVKYLAECPWCLSFWIGVGVATARRVAPRQWHPVAVALAASAVTGFTAEREGW